MGLDIYLVDAAQATAEAAHEALWEALYARKESGEFTEEQYDEERKNLPARPSRHEVPSKVDPDNYNNRRYLRSSYNDGGFNNAVPQFLQDEHTSLYDIFKPLLDDPEANYDTEWKADSIPQWRRVAVEAREVATRLRAVKFPMRAEHEGPNAFNPLAAQAGAQAAIEFAVKARIKAAESDGPFSDGGWSSLEGTFFGPEGLTVYAAVPGPGPLGQMGTWLVYEQDLSWYATQAEIVAEFAEEAIEIIERDGSVYMHWSG